MCSGGAPASRRLWLARSRSSCSAAESSKGVGEETAEIVLTLDGEPEFAAASKACCPMHKLQLTASIAKHRKQGSGHGFWPGLQNAAKFRFPSLTLASRIQHQPLTMETILLVTVLAGTLVQLGFWAIVLRRLSAASQVDVKAEVAGALERLDSTLGQKISLSTADMASRLEQTKGDLRQQVTDRIQQGFSEIRCSVEQQLASGREEQNRSLADGRREMTNSLLLTTQQLKAEIQGLNQQTAQSLDGIRDRVDSKLMAITEQVQREAGSEHQGRFCAVRKSSAAFEGGRGTA